MGEGGGGVSRRQLSALLGAALFAPGLARAQVEDEEASVRLAEDVARRMAGPVMVDGRGPFSFVVDTGANATAVSADLAAALGLKITGSGVVNGIAGAERVPTALIRELRVGSVSATRLRVPVLPRQELGGDGLLGVDVMKNRVVRLDMEKWEFGIGRPSDSRPEARAATESGRLRRQDDGRPADPRAILVPARQRFGQLMIVDADLYGVQVSAFLDSGAQITVGNTALQRVARTNAQSAAQTTRVQLMSATGQTIGGDLLDVPGLRLGGLKIGGLSAVFADLHAFKIWDLEDVPALLIGMDVLRHFRSVELNFRRKHVIFRIP